MFSPTISAWCRAINAGHLTTWTHLNSKKVIQTLPESTAILKFHMDQTHANNQSYQPPTYEAADHSSFTQAPLIEPAVGPELSDAQ